MQQQTKAYLFAGAAVFFWSTVASAFKLTLQYLEPVQLVFLASLFSALALLIILLVKRKLRSLWTLNRKTVLACFLLGLLNPGLYYVSLFTAYDRLPAQDALSINYSWPVMLTLLSVLILKQRTSASELLSIIIAYCGVVIIATHGDIVSLHFADALGVGLALASTVIWASFWIINLRQKAEPEIVLFLSFSFSLPLLFIISRLYAPIDHITWQALAGAVYIGLFEMGFTFLLWLNALRLSKTTAKISSLAFIAPFLSLIFISFFVGETIMLSTLVGLLVIITGISLQQIINRRSANPDNIIPDNN